MREKNLFFQIWGRGPDLEKGLVLFGFFFFFFFFLFFFYVSTITLRVGSGHKINPRGAFFFFWFAFTIEGKKTPPSSEQGMRGFSLMVWEIIREDWVY